MRSRRHWTKFKIYFIVAIFLCGFTWFLIKFNHTAKPLYHAVAESELKNATMKVVKDTFSTIQYDSNSLIKLNRNNNGKVSDIQYDTYALNQILIDFVDQVENNLIKAEKGEALNSNNQIYFHDGYIEKIPIGYFTGIAFLADTGFKVGIKMHYLNDCLATIQVNTKPYGINSTIIELSLSIEVAMRVVSPFLLDETKISLSFPLVVQVVQGDIPMYLPASTIMQTS